MMKLQSYLAGAVAVAAALAVPAAAQKAPAKAPVKTAAKPAVKAAPKATSTKVKLASPANIVTAIKSCSTAVSASGLVPANLAKAGWKTAPVRNKAGQVVKPPLRMYSHPGSQAIIALPQSNGANGGCIVMANVASAADIALAGNVLSGEVGVKPIRSKNGSPLWLAGERAIEMNTLGTKTAPSVRVVVAYAKGGKG